MRDREVRRAEFAAMLEAVDAEAEREGCITIQELDPDLTKIIARAAENH